MIGSYVSLEVRGIGSDAQVRWQVGRRMGGKFVDPIGLQRCERAPLKTEAEQEA